MKILFYDVKKLELNYLLENIPNKIEPYFFKNNLNSRTYIDEKMCNTKRITS